MKSITSSMYIMNIFMHERIVFLIERGHFSLPIPDHILPLSVTKCQAIRK